MPKKIIKRLMPDHQTIKTNKHLQIFGDLLHNPNLWHLNRHSIAKAFAVGLFFAFIPVPFQMVLAAGVAIIVHSNLPLSIALVWITNPFTMPPIFYGSYLVGVSVLGHKEQEFAFEPSWQWLEASISSIGPAFIIGSLICATVASLLGFFVVDILWRRTVRKAWINRHKK